MKNQIKFYLFVFGFSFGIFVSSYMKMGFSFFLFLLLLSLILLIYARWFASSKRIILLLILFIISFGLGILRYEIKDIRKDNSQLVDLVGEKVILIGMVGDEPAIKEESLQLVVDAEVVIFQDQEYSINDKVLVSAGLFPTFVYGDKIEISGKLAKPEDFATDLGKDFDYIGFLAKDDIYYQISFAQVKLLGTGGGSFIKRKLFAFKNSFMGKVNYVIKEPESSLLGGLLLGAKNSLGKELQNDFRLAGVSHIIALSGYNITIVAFGIMTMLAFLPGALSIVFGVLGIILFAIMTGGSATVMRASLMALLVLLARSSHRKYDIKRALLLAGVFMLVQNPKILVFDISFQLSFLATIALILVSPIIEKKMLFITPKHHLRELVVATISTQIFVLPFLLYKMGLFSVFALFTNVLILPVIPLIMLLGFIIGILGFVSLTVTIPIAFICSLLLTYMLQVIYVFSHLPFSSVSITSFPISLMIIMYTIMMVYILREKRLSHPSQ